jgi:hypothetical protein
MSGSSSIRRLKDCPVVMDLHELAPIDGRDKVDGYFIGE